jgi:hypothetical protein
MSEAVSNIRYDLKRALDKLMRSQIESVYEFSELLLSNNELTQPSNRICCARFFYYNFNVSPAVD